MTIKYFKKKVIETRGISLQINSAEEQNIFLAFNKKWSFNFGAASDFGVVAVNNYPKSIVWYNREGNIIYCNYFNGTLQEGYYTPVTIKNLQITFYTTLKYLL
jgi:hypothetical protein